MKLPKKLDKSKLDMKQVAQELIDAKKTRMKTLEEFLEWLDDDDIYVFDAKESGFEDWTEDDYAANIRVNNFEPYGFRTKNYIVVHDYV